MSAPKVSAQVPAWPPLVIAARLPRWLRIRDILLTLTAWGFLGWLLRDPIYVAYDYFRHPIFQLTTAKPLDLSLLWWRLRYFWMISAALIAWLCLWGWIDRRRLRAARNSPQPPALALEAQAGWAGLEQKIVSEARKFRVANVRFKEDGNIAGFEGVIGERPADAIEPVPPQPAA